MTGSVIARQTTTTVGGVTNHSSSVSAGFAVGAGAGCTGQTVGPCQVSVCTFSSPDAGAAAAGTPESAGAIMVTGGTHNVTLTPDAMNHYMTNIDSTQDLWTAGQMLTITAAGATGGVPAFTNMLRGPASITVTMIAGAAWPAFPGTITITRANDTTLTWTGAAAASTSVIVDLSSVSSTGTAAMACTFDATAQTGTIPHAALQMLPAGNGSITVSHSSRMVITSGGYQIELLLSNTGATSGGGSATATVMLQ